MSSLFLHLIYFKGLRWEIVGDEGGALAGIGGAGGGDGDDQLGAVEGVLTVHIVAVEGDGLDVALALHALKLDADGLLGVAGVDDLDDDLACGAVEDG